jgi:hypothetical protein
MMLAETIVASVTLVVLASLWLANAVDRRLNEPEPEAKIWPYEYPAITNPCPFCGVSVARGRDQGLQDAWGPCAPLACTKGEECPGYPKPHLHLSCGYCKGSWLMATKG